MVLFIQILGVLSLIGGLIGAVSIGSPTPLISGMVGFAGLMGLARIINLLTQIAAKP